MEDQDWQRTTKLEQLRQAIHDGLNSREPVPWNPEGIRQMGRLKRAARANAFLKGV